MCLLYIRAIWDPTTPLVNELVDALQALKSRPRHKQFGPR